MNSIFVSLAFLLTGAISTGMLAVGDSSAHGRAVLGFLAVYCAASSIIIELRAIQRILMDRKS